MQRISAAANAVQAKPTSGRLSGTMTLRQIIPDSGSELRSPHRITGIWLQSDDDDDGVNRDD